MNFQVTFQKSGVVVRPFILAALLFYPWHLDDWDNLSTHQQFLHEQTQSALLAEAVIK